jgi:hypothetical protein
MALRPGESPRNPRGKPYHILSVRPLIEADLATLREKSAPVARLQTLRDSHHNVARHMASGLSNVQIADVTGHTLGSLSRWRRDPSMQDLVAHYRAMITEEWHEEVDQIQRYATRNMLKAERMISDKLDEADETGDLPTFRDLVSITSDRYDRFGYGKRSSSTNLNIDYASALEAAIARQRQAPPPPAIEAE